MDRVAVIRNSMTVFVCGIIGLLPVLGFVVAIYALVLWGTVRFRSRDAWNPASAYLDAGAWLALLSLLGSLLLIAVALVTAGG